MLTQINSAIAGISTGLTNSGISIIRISGKNSLEIISKMFTSHEKLRKNNIIYGSIINSNGQVMDKVLVSYFQAPNSFTGEDTCEINCHGGKQITLEILEETLKNGAVLAQAGEFSKRAFINGKLDLSEAEAIMDLINSKTRLQSKIAVSQLEGRIYNKINSFRDDLVELLAQIEVSIDYPEYDYEEISNERIKEILLNQKNNIQSLISAYEEGRYIKDGVNVAILGSPNVGKSSLLNYLANYEKSIVTDIAGTTRDIVEETITIDDLVLNFFDTAGLRQTEDVVEKIGVQRSIKKIDEVDLVIYIITGDQKILETDKNALLKIQNKGLKLIGVINKMDKSQKSIFDANMKELKDIGLESVVCTCINDGTGIDDLKEKIINIFKKSDYDYNDEYVLVNKRHKSLLSNSLDLINDTLIDLDKNQSIDILAINITQATKYLGEIIGKDVSQDVVDKIFEKFCLGK